MLDTNKYTVDFSNVNNYREIHSILKQSLNFPYYYGGHLDALFDCLTDMLGDISIIEIYGIEKLKSYNEYDKKLLKVFVDSKHAFNDAFADRFFVTIVHQDGTREEMK